jgi:hypothetical protein
VAQIPNLLHEATSIHVISRFCLRTIILVVFAAFAGSGFARGLTTLLWMAIVFSAMVGIIKRERPFGALLNHWDETLAYAALLFLIGVFNHPVPD